MAASTSVQRRLAILGRHVSVGVAAGHVRPLSIQTTSDKTVMKDEYGNMDDSGEAFRLPRLQLESGRVLLDAEVRYRTFGTLNQRRDNALV
eukprot:2156220-Pyramimonas_sp.AAC.2